MVDTPATQVVAPGSPRFSLHTLGWRAFQDLCAAVLREVWGQSVTAFADSNDAGRDGAFYGRWVGTNSNGMQDVPDGPYVLQCKHTKHADSTLAPSVLDEELGKVQGLVRRGLCGTYVLLTNARVTGSSEEEIRNRLRGMGVAHAIVLDGQWLSDIISSHRALRMYVPRVYGLGDLSQILDERAYTQAASLLASSSDQVSTFVPTSSYRKAARALHDFGFVLLLGEPAVGKSTIALMLAVSAADNWGCLTVKARSSDELVSRWNPNEKGQFFWVDDAFGGVRHEEYLTHDWVRDLPQVMTAIKGGARVVLTSRSYIYEEARPFLKTYAYPLLNENQVIVDVASITTDERRKILYNHLSAGDQPGKVLAKMKPHLEAAADVEAFRPETARRLGLQVFTKNMPFTRSGIVSFMGHPQDFLADIYSQLDVSSHAALALVYSVAYDGLSCPLVLNAARRNLLKQADVSLHSAGLALKSLTGTFLRKEADRLGREFWTFKHPTLREGFAAWLADQQHLLPAVVATMDDQTILDHTECRCDGEGSPGTLLIIPPSLYRTVAKRLAALFRAWPNGSCWTGSALDYLGKKCSDEMLKIYVQVDPLLSKRSTDFDAFAAFVEEPLVLARLYRAGLLSEDIRLRAIDRMASLAVHYLDISWLQEGPWQTLLAEGDRQRILDIIRDHLAPNLHDAIRDGWADKAFFRTDESSDRSAELDPRTFSVDRVLESYIQLFEDRGERNTVRKFSEALLLYNSEHRPVVTEVIEGTIPLFDIEPTYFISETSRSMFSDIDEGGC